MAAEADGPFLARWSRRKARSREGLPPEDTAPPAPPATQAAAPDAPAPASERSAEEAAAPPPPTLADVAALSADSDFRRFVAPGVDEGVKRAALKKLFFGDPHFNVMDRLDVYIDDYNAPDPLPASMLRRLWQARALGLAEDEPAPPAAAEALPDGAPVASAPPSPAALPCRDEDPDLRLQPDDDARRAGADQGARSRGV